MDNQKLLEECRRFFDEQACHRLETFPLTIHTVVLNDGSVGRLRRQHLPPRALQSFAAMSAQGAGAISTAHGNFGLRWRPNLAWADVELSENGECLGLTTIVWSADSWPGYFRHYRRQGMQRFGFTALPAVKATLSPWLASLLSRRGLRRPVDNLALLWQAAVGAMDQVVNPWR